jgi:hypothetical protein
MSYQPVPHHDDDRSEGIPMMAIPPARASPSPPAAAAAAVPAGYTPPRVAAIALPALPAPMTWSCSSCTYENPRSSTICDMCQTQRHVVQAQFASHHAAAASDQHEPGAVPHYAVAVPIAGMDAPGGPQVIATPLIADDNDEFLRRQQEQALASVQSQAAFEQQILDATRNDPALRSLGPLIVWTPIRMRSLALPCHTSSRPD